MIAPPLPHSDAASAGKPADARVYPTPRLAVAAALGALWFFGIPWGGSVFLWLGVGHNLVLLALCLADLRGLADSRACNVGRDCEPALSIGQQNPVWVVVAHRGRRPLRAAVRDEPPPEFEVTPRVLALDVPAGETLRAAYRARPADRGDYRFGDLNVRFTTVLGLLTRQQRIPASGLVKVYPDVFQTRKHLLLAKQNRLTQMGLRRSRLHGQGQEFEHLRDYLPDDSLRHVDWKATARRGRLIAREYDVEQSQNILILLDLGRTMASHTVEENGEPGLTKADLAINAAVLLTHVAAQADDRVGLFCFARGPIVWVPPGKGGHQAARLMDALYPLKPRIEEADYHANLLLASRRQRKRSLVFLFTDLIDPDASKRLIRSTTLLASKHLVVCVALADYELPSLIAAEPTAPADLYTQAVALGILRERRKALAQLTSLGVVAMDATPKELSVAAVNQYLKLKREARL